MTCKKVNPINRIFSYQIPFLVAVKEILLLISFKCRKHTSVLHMMSVYYIMYITQIYRISCIQKYSTCRILGFIYHMVKVVFIVCSMHYRIVYLGIGQIYPTHDITVYFFQSLKVHIRIRLFFSCSLFLQCICRGSRLLYGILINFFVGVHTFFIFTLYFYYIECGIQCYCQKYKAKYCSYLISQVFLLSIILTIRLQVAYSPAAHTLLKP